MSSEDAVAAAAAEGLKLVTGKKAGAYRGVLAHGGGYRARVYSNGKLKILGTFATPEEAALHVARHQALRHRLHLGCT